MNAKILLSFEAGHLRAVKTNGDAEVFVEIAETLDGINPVPTTEIPCAEFEALLARNTITA
jgi:hypothetical protein